MNGKLRNGHSIYCTKLKATPTLLVAGDAAMHMLLRIPCSTENGRSSSSFFNLNTHSMKKEREGVTQTAPAGLRKECVTMLSQVERHNHGGIIVHTKPLVQDTTMV